MKNELTKILVISDTSRNVTYISKSLSAESHKFAIECAGTLRDAAEACDRRRPDVILSELRLSDGGVPELLNLSHDVCPVILLVITGQERSAEEAVKAGVIDYFVKSGSFFRNLPLLIELSLQEWSLLCERKRLVAMLRSNEEHYLRISEQMRQRILHFRFSGEILYHNEYFARMHNCSRDNTASLRIQDFWPAAALRALEKNRQQLENGRPVDLELEIRHRDGHMIPMQVSVYLIASDTEPYLIAFHHDTLGRKYGSPVSPASRSWGHVFDQVTDLIFIVDENNTITHVNKAMAACLKLKEHEIIGRSCHEVVHGLDEPPLKCPYTGVNQDDFRIFEVEEHLLGESYKVRVTQLHKEFEAQNSFIHIARKST